MMMNQVDSSSFDDNKDDDNNNNNNNNYTCFECGKQGHIKSECPIYLRKHVGEKKAKKDRKQKKAYIVWEDSASTTSNSSSEEEIANICLMSKSMNDPSSSEETKVNPDYEELLEAFNEMHEEAQRLVVLIKKLKRKLKIVSRCKVTACDDTFTSYLFVLLFQGA